MTDTKYNGWTNYATWRVNLKIFDNWSFGDILGYEDEEPENTDAHEMADILKTYVEELIDEQSPADGIAHAYAMAFLNDVNWIEIAQKIIEDEVMA